MMTKSESDLSLQNISASEKAMQVLHQFKDDKYKNISIGIELKPSKKVIDDPEGLKADAYKFLRYVNIFGMFE